MYEYYLQCWDSSVAEPKFLCLAHSKTKQTEMSDFGAEKDVLQGPCKENREAHAQKNSTSLMGL